MLAAQALAAQGYTRLASVDGGFAAWQRAGLPLAGAPADADFMERYSRHLRLPQVGLEGQRKLERARMLLVGAGGLGSPAAFYLAAAGVGFLRIVDDDVVHRRNRGQLQCAQHDGEAVMRIVGVHDIPPAVSSWSYAVRSTLSTPISGTRAGTLGAPTSSFTKSTSGT